jgi:glutathione S-transferase
MKLYGHPISTTTLPVLLLAAEAKIDLEFVLVDLATGEHLGEAYGKINPLHLVPVLVDGDFTLTESSAIMKYLAEKVRSPLYPADLRQRARVNERMDWFNANFYRDWGYNLIYPQLFAHHKRPSDELQAGTLKWGQQGVTKHLRQLDQYVLGSNPYLCGSEMTIADLFGLQILCAGETIGCRFSAYPQVDAWVKRLKALPSWAKVNETAQGWGASMRDREFVTA